MTKPPFSLPARYEVEDVKSGGQGNVYFCNDLELKRTVAIKCIQNVSNLPRLMDEIRALERVRSKHVVEIYDLLQKGSNVALILEFIDGEELTKLKLNKADGTSIIKIFFQLACGISDIHEQKHIHRDIKPPNIMVDSEGVVKIFDFGLAREQNVDDNTIGFRGTHGFAAPELYVTGKVKLTPAIDVYAFGATCWYLLTGDLPSELKKRPPSRLQSKLQTVSKIPPLLANFLDTTLSYSSDERPTMWEVRDVLKRYLAFDMHQGTLAHNQIYRVNSSKRNVTIRANTNIIEVHYDGLNFLARNISGHVFINNKKAVQNMVLPDSCVITLGDAGPGRMFVPFNVSNPEVVL